jgi:hypothetical protein
VAYATVVVRFRAVVREVPGGSASAAAAGVPGRFVDSLLIASTEFGGCQYLDELSKFLLGTLPNRTGHPTYPERQTP